MSFLVVLAVAILVSIGWLLSVRFLGLNSRIQKRDPASAEQRLEWIRAFRDLTFFFLIYFIITTFLIFVLAFVYALIDPPNKFNFFDSFGQLVNSVSQEDGLLSIGNIWGALIILVGSVASVLLAQRVARGRYILDLGLRYYKALPFDVLMGLLLGPILIALVFLFEQATGLVVGNSGPDFNAGELALWGFIFLCVALSEELIIRGYILQTLNLAWGGVAAIVASSVFWGLTHFLNPHSGFVPAANVAFAGLIFAYAYMITGHLWLPIAFHFSWNFAQGAIFGYPVSGFKMPSPVILPLVEGPDALTGGQFGPEGGMVGLFAILMGGLLLYGWSRIRQNSQTNN